MNNLEDLESYELKTQETFLRLEDKEGKSIYLNQRHIVSIKKYPDGFNIYTIMGESYSGTNSILNENFGE